MIEFERLFVEHSESVFRFILNMCGDRTEAEELTKTVFKKAFSSAVRFRGNYSVKTWLSSIAYDEYLKFIMRRKTDSAVPNKNRKDELRRMIFELPEDLRKTLVLRAYAGLPFDEIAEESGISQNSAKVLYCRAKRAIFDR